MDEQKPKIAPTFISISMTRIQKKSGCGSTAEKGQEPDPHKMNADPKQFLLHILKPVGLAVLCTQKTCVADPGCLSRIPDPDFYTSRIPDPKTATKERG